MSTAVPKSSAEAIYVEAAAWVVRLHGPNRSPEVEIGLRRWLAEHPDHRQAFELATETWSSSAQAPPQTNPGIRTALAAVAGAAAVALLVGLTTWLNAPQMQTKIGEQRTVRLEDGSQVSLNTDTQLTVHFDDKTRLIKLERGEALFDVARQPQRPFVVMVGERKIEALGTSFVVRRDARQLDVTLVEGKVAVWAAPAADAVTLAPGQRLTLSAANGPPKVDQPDVEKITAWQRGLVMLEATPLSVAVEEMNRYSPTKLAIEQPEVARLEVSGIFRAGDSMRFARAVAKTYQLVVIEQPDRIVLAGAGVN